MDAYTIFPEILLRHAPDAQYVFVTFAGAFLVKVRHPLVAKRSTNRRCSQLLQPKYSQYFTHERRQEIRTLVQEAVDLLGAPEVVVDDKHGPKLFSRFLGGLLASQSINPDTFSPLPSKNNHLRRASSRSKGKGKDSSGSLPSPLQFNGSGTEHLSPLSLSDSSPVQQFTPLEGNSRGHSPSTFGFGLGLNDIYQDAPMPVDQELLDSISFLSDPVWQDTSVPGESFFSNSFSPLALVIEVMCLRRCDLGFSWVNQLSAVSSSALHVNDYALFEQQQYSTF